MRISDWSSDVCSSDLRRRHPVAPDAHTHHDHHVGDGLTTAVLDVRGLHWASEKAVIERTLGRLDGVHSVDANPVAQPATVAYRPGVTSVADLRQRLEACGYHCAAQPVPNPVCPPLQEPRPPDDGRRGPGRSEDHTSELTSLTPLS